MSNLKASWRRRREAVVVDRRFDIAFFCLWACYGAWGISSAIINTTYLAVPVGWYPTMWGTAIGVFAIISCCTIVASFFTAADRLKERIRQKRLEAISVSCLGGLIAIYPLIELFQLFTQHPPRPDSLALGVSYMVMVIYRVSTQLKRAQELRILDRRYQDGQKS